MNKPGLYKMRTMVRFTGFSPSLLRAWERRHGLLDPVRGPGGHRLYSEDDLRLLRRIRQLLQEGQSIGEVALLGRDQLLAKAPASNGARPKLAPAVSAEPAVGRSSAEESGGQQLGRFRQAIFEAALAMDKAGIERALDDAFSLVSPDRAIREVIEPAAHRLGHAWTAGQCSVASEHLASAVFGHRLRKLIEAADSAAPTSSPIICACFPDEYHDLGALVVSYRLARQGVKVCYMGAALPLEDVGRACDVLLPRAVVLSVTREALYWAHQPRLLDLLRRQAGKIEFLIGGQGVPQSDAEVTGTGAKLCYSGDQAIAELLGTG